MSLAGPVYKLSATADRKPGPDGCYAVLPVTSGSICFDEKISAPVFLVPTVVPGTAAAPKLGLGEDRYKSSDSTKVFPGDSTPIYLFKCGTRPPVPERDSTAPQPNPVAEQQNLDQGPDFQDLKDGPTKKPEVVGPGVKSAEVNSPENSTSTADRGQKPPNDVTPMPEIKEEVIVSGYSETSEDETADPATTTDRQALEATERRDDRETKNVLVYGRDTKATPGPDVPVSDEPQNPQTPIIGGGTEKQKLNDELLDDDSDESRKE